MCISLTGDLYHHAGQGAGHMVLNTGFQQALHASHDQLVISCGIGN